MGEALEESPATIAMYEYIVKGLIRHAKRMKSQDPFILARHKGVLLSIACLDIEPILPEPLARQRFQAAIYAIQNWPGYFNPRALELLCPEPSESESDRQNRVALKRAAWMSKRHVKSKVERDQLPIQRWRKILDAILMSESKWAIPAADWLCATLVTGLRPGEWREATLDANRLSITSAAFDNEKEEVPVQRTIELVCTTGELHCVQRFLRSVRKLDYSDFHRMYEGVRSLTKSIGQQTFPDWESVISIDAARRTSLAVKKLSAFDSLEGISKPQTSPGPAWSRALRAQAALFEDQTRAFN